MDATAHTHSIDTRQARNPVELELPAVLPTARPELDLQVASLLASRHYPRHALGRVEVLLQQLARIQTAEGEAFTGIRLDRPQVVVFAGDHGIVDERVSAFTQETSRQRVEEVLTGEAPVNTLARLHGFDLTVVDAGLAQRLERPVGADERVALLPRKIGHGTRNMVLSPAMPLRQAISAIQAGMDVVRHLPGRVLALGDIGVGSTACAALLLSRLCGVPLPDACGRDQESSGGPDSLQRQHRLEKLQQAAARHRKAVTPLEALAAMGGFEIAMQAGAMLQAASERRIVLVDGFVSGAAALVARGLRPAVADYLVFGHRSTEPGHRLLLIHMQAQPLLDMELRVGQGAGALMAWPLLQAAQALLAKPMIQT
ncbi:nicotinate-nucleotide--dimethylbenzimidazole phosphoribosyltransferase [Hydrogenophaga sp.]|uniref:nicotinate-nucleotide--dimethylbenzimidazole phosphoribosyltransferase n=1 Tax=Hydrogenophaga sp. TaxID=1904254 RepID=UPI002BA2FE8B|nr:nicotinate-nucleotide--dimethylbenzimidazole phosphoribosyltransferase [Hydrogenophaga sp.]HMP10446.1 nicotinate-nucleotide--dimethylbenzimidazole phosphoribosyltransferase [Hydrogenophaga sp.]